MITPKQKDILWAINRDFTARSGCFAPIFWATKADRADINDIGTMDRKAYSFSAMPTLAEAVTPRAFITLVIMRKDMLTRKSCAAVF